MKPTGIVIHSTGANNPKIGRYVQPAGAKGNHWNKPDVSKCVHGFIGLDEKDEIATCQTLPWNYRSWGCGKGEKGSYNKTHIQFEICEDGLDDLIYFTSVIEEAVDVCAYLCNEFNIHPWEGICSHKEAAEEGYASNHGDPEHWMRKFNLTMHRFRSLVTESS